jgi:hypothetical protein
MTQKIVLRKLKSLEEIYENIYPNGWKIYGDYVENSETGWHINDEMMELFGDKQYHKFEEDRNEYNEYTHRCVEDEYSYHESWFEEVIDFGIED